MKRFVSLFLAVAVFCCACFAAVTGPVLAAAPALPDVQAGAYILVEKDTGRVLAGENTDIRLPMASTTKIMTALLTLEQPDLDEYFEVDGKAILVEGSSMGLLPGDQVSLYTLAVGMLLHSGNDAAGAAAVRIAGSAEDFVALMNERAAEYGLENTHFSTPSGLDGDDHYTSAEDLATLARHAMANETFAEICAAYKMQVAYGNPPYSRWLTNHNRLLKEYDGSVGVKTGFTKKAGRCLVSAATRDGITLICVTLKASDDWNVHKKLFDYGFSRTYKTHLADTFAGASCPVVGGATGSVPLTIDGNTEVALLDEESRQIRFETHIPAFVYAPVEKGTKVGEVRVYLEDTPLGSWALVADEAIDAAPAPQKSLWQKITGWFTGG